MSDRRLKAERYDVDELNIMYGGLCVSFTDEGRRKIGIVREFHHGCNLVTMEFAGQVFEVPRGNVHV